MCEYIRINAIMSGYTLEEVAKHCMRTSCWIVIHDRVYDVTNFLDEVRN